MDFRIIALNKNKIIQIQLVEYNRLRVFSVIFAGLNMGKLTFGVFIQDLNQN